MIRNVSVLLLTALGAASAFAQYSSAAALVKAGADAYLKEGASAALQAWVKGSALEGNTQALSQSNMLRQIEDFYGRPEGTDIVADHPVSSRVHMVYFVVYFAKGPLFARLQAYELSSQQWVTTEFKFQTEAAGGIFPVNLLVPR